MGVSSFGPVKSLRAFALAAVLSLAVARPSPALEISGTITGNATWDPTDNPCVITGTLTVARDASLTILPGVEVQLGEDDRLRSLADGLFLLLDLRDCCRVGLHFLLAELAVLVGVEALLERCHFLAQRADLLDLRRILRLDLLVGIDARL